MKQETAKRILEQTKHGFDTIATHFSVTRAWPWKIMEGFLSYLKPGNKILDVGCGNGRLFDFLKDKEVFYTGIDNSKNLIEIASKKYRRLKEEGETSLEPEFFIGDALNLPIQKNEFDFIFMIAVLHHIPSVELQVQALKNAHGVLKRGGYLFLTCWNLLQPKLIWQNFKNRRKNHHLYDDLDWQDFLIPWYSSDKKLITQRFYHAFAEKELRKLVEKAGFKVEQIFYEYKGEKSNWLKGFNLVVVARKN